MRGMASFGDGGNGQADHGDRLECGNWRRHFRSRERVVQVYILLRF